MFFYSPSSHLGLDLEVIGQVSPFVFSVADLTGCGHDYGTLGMENTLANSPIYAQNTLGEERSKCSRKKGGTRRGRKKKDDGGGEGGEQVLVNTVGINSSGVSLWPSTI